MVLSQDTQIESKICLKCVVVYPATEELFSLDRRTKTGLKCWCKKCRCLTSKKYYHANRDRCADSKKEYYTTFSGRVSCLMKNVKARCCNPRSSNYKYYGGKGITLEFTRKELEGWLLENNIDPRGLEIRLKDSSKNYNPGNIEFLTKSEHAKLHWKLWRIRNAESIV